MTSTERDHCNVVFVCLMMLEGQFQLAGICAVVSANILSRTTKGKVTRDQKNKLTLSCPLDVNVQDQGQGQGYLSKYLISGFIYQFFHVYMKKSSKSSLKKKVS